MSLQLDRSKIEVPYKTRFWGQDCTCDPRFVGAVLGDGAVLVGIQPLSTRPNYYLIRVDSSWHLHNCRVCEDRCPDEITEHLDEIYDAIEDEYGEAERTRESNEQYLEENPGAEPDPTDWPVFDYSCGTSWWVEDATPFLATDSAA